MIDEEARWLALGLLIGFPIAAAPGPMFVLVLRRTLAKGWRSGLISGLGIATGDAIYAAIAAFGIAAVISVLIAQRRWIGLAGGIALVVLGGRALIRQFGPHPHPALQAGEGSFVGDGITTYASMVALTLSNPPTILSFAAVFAGLGVQVGSGWQLALALVIGVMLGSALWWVLLTALIAMLRTRISPVIIRAVGLTSGLALIGFGCLISLQSL